MNFFKSNTIRQFSMAIGGTAGISAANFLLSALLLVYSSADIFGGYAFMQILISFGMAISHALLGSPLMFFINNTDNKERGFISSYFSVNIIIVTLSAMCIFLSGYYLLGSYLTAALFSCSAFLIWIRTFGRSYLNSQHKVTQVAISDASYSLPILSGALILWITNHITLDNVLMLQCIGALMSTTALGHKFNTIQFRAVIKPEFIGFFDGFKSKGKHSIIGALANEGTTNIHSYLIVVFWGPSSFAPIAATLLLYRPINLVMVSLTQLERPKIARFLHKNAFDKACQVINKLRKFVLLTWGVNILIVVLILTSFAGLIVKDGYQKNIVIIAAISYAIINFLKCLRVPDTALLQANGNFKDISSITLKSLFITVPIVILLISNLSPIWSLAGILLGEIYASVMVITLANNYLKNRVKSINS